MCIPADDSCPRANWWAVHAFNRATLKEKQKMKTLIRSINRSPLRCGFFTVAIALCWLALSAPLEAGCPNPPGICFNQNTAVGEDALFNVTTGVWNVGVGFRALFNTADGNQNTGVGFQSLFNNISGDHSTAVGGQALYNNTTGNDNVGIGFNTLFTNTSGNRNTGMGYRTLAFNSIGSENTAVGWNALYNNRAGASDNTAVGSQALFGNVGGVTNVGVGVFAAQNSDADFNTAVGGFALKANTNGTRNTAVGAGAMESGDGGSDNTAVGELAGNDITGNSNTCLGKSAGSNLTSGSQNIYVGKGVQPGAPDELRFIRIGDTSFTDYDNFQAGIQNRGVSAAANPHIVLVDDNGKLGTVAVNEIGIKTKQPQAIPQRVQPKAISPDPNQAMLNRRVKELQATVARQQKQIDALSAGLQKVSAQLEVNKPAPQVVANKP
jgi:hypothetical protein